MKNMNNNTDDFIKETLGSFEAPPPFHNWDKINDQLNSSDNDAFTQKFENFEVKPNEKVWDEIEQHLPYHLRIHRHLTWASKIAAVLLVAMLSTIFFNNWNQNSELSTTHNAIINPSETGETITASVEEEQHFVFDIKKTKTTKSITDADDELNDLLVFILDDSDELSELIDEASVDASLEPADPLLMEGLVLVVPEDDEPIAEEIDLTIKIPLVVVEESEIESLINLYDANVASGATTPIPQE